MALVSCRKRTMEPKPWQDSVSKWTIASTCTHLPVAVTSSWILDWYGWLHASLQFFDMLSSEQSLNPKSRSSVLHYPKHVPYAHTLLRFDYVCVLRPVEGTGCSMHIISVLR